MRNISAIASLLARTDGGRGGRREWKPEERALEMLFTAGELVKALYLDPVVGVTDELVSYLASALRECADWHVGPEVVIRRPEPKRLAALLKSAVK